MYSSNIAIFVLVTILSININCMNISVPVANFEDSNFRDLITAIDASITVSTTDIAKSVRMIFHDCVSGCNGCIDFTNPDNTGLDVIVKKANGVYNKFRRTKFYNTFSLSVADTFVLFAGRAVYISSNYDGLTLPVVDFKFGRKDCINPIQDNKEIFASALGNWENIKKFYQDIFGFSNQDIVAIMGAHSLGRTWETNSGYAGPWVKKDNNIFGVDYYKNMINSKLDYRPTAVGTTKSQWNSALDRCTDYDRKNCRPLPKPDQRIMLNADMCLFKNFNTDPSTGMADCSYNTCKLNDETSELVTLYANNEPQFKKDFSAAFQKMIEHVPNSDSILIDPLIANQKKEIIKTIMKYTQTAPIKDQFKAYHLLFNKTYSINSEEGIKRYKMFKSNLKLIKELNSKFTLNKYNINAFTDMTNEEYVKSLIDSNGGTVDFDNMADVVSDQYSHLYEDA